MTEITLLSEVSGTYILAGGPGVGKTSLALATASDVAGDVAWFDFQNGPKCLSRLADHNNTPMPSRYSFCPDRHEMSGILEGLQPGDLAVVDCWQTACSIGGMNTSYSGEHALWLAPLHCSAIRAGARLLVIDSDPGRFRNLKDAWAVSTYELRSGQPGVFLKSRFPASVPDLDLEPDLI